MAKVNMRDVAKRARVSHMTVSRVLQNGGKVRPETRARVLRAAEELDYRVNPMVRAYAQHLRSGKGRELRANLGWVGGHGEVMGDEAVAWVNACRDAVRRRAEEEGFSISDLSRQHAEMKESAFVRMLQARGIQGLVLADDAMPRGIQFAPDNFAVVAIGTGSSRLPVHRIVPDHQEDLHTVFDHLLRMGYRRIGLYQHSPLLSPAAKVRQSAFLLEQFRLPGHERISPRQGDAFGSNPHAATAGLLQWMERDNIEVLLIDNADLAAELKLAGLRIPDDLALVNVGMNPWPSGSLSGLRHRPEILGKVALDHLASLLLQNQRGLPEIPIKIAIPAAWHEGESLPVRSTQSLAQKTAAPFA